MSKKTLSFSVEENVKERARALFPAGLNQTALISLLDAYEQMQAQEPQEPQPVVVPEPPTISEYILENCAPFVRRLIEATTAKLSHKYQREVSAQDVLFDIFLKYTIQRWSEWFYPFVVSDDEIKAILQETNPEISFNELKRKLNKERENYDY